MTHDDRRTGFWLAASILTFLLAFLPLLNFAIDGNSMLSVAESLILGGKITVPPHLGQLGTGGNHYSIWYPLLSFLEAPWVGLGYGAAKILHVPAQGHFLAIGACALFQALIACGITWATYSFSRETGTPRRDALLVSWGVFFGSCLLVYSRTLFADALLTFWVSWGCLQTLRASTSRQALLWTAICSACAILTKPSGILLGPLLTACFLFAYRSPKKAWAPLLGVAAGLMLYLAYNQIRWGNPLNFGSRPSLSLTFFPRGIIQYLISPWIGLLIYNPFVLASLFSLSHRGWLREKHLWLPALTIAAFFFFYACWPATGWDWGSRHLLVILPACGIFAGRLLSTRARPAILGLFLLGFVVNGPNLVSFYESYFSKIQEERGTTSALLWTWGDSPAFHLYSTAFRQVKNSIHSDLRELIRLKAVQSDRSNQSQVELPAFKVIPAWWWFGPAIGVPRFFLILIALCFIGISGLTARWAWLAPENASASEPREQ